MRNPTTWLKLGIIGYAGPEITNGLGAFLYLEADMCAWQSHQTRTSGFNNGTPSGPHGLRALRAELIWPVGLRIALTVLDSLRFHKKLEQ